MIFRGKLIKEGELNFEEDINVIWNVMYGFSKTIAKAILGKSRGKGQLSQGTWWWNL